MKLTSGEYFGEEELINSQIFYEYSTCCDSSEGKNILYLNLIF